MTITRIERRKIEANDDKPPLWLVGFTDLVTLLLAFFILLFATSIPKDEPWNAVSESVRSTFGGEENITVMEGNTGHQDADRSWESQDKDPGLELQYLHSVVKKYVASEPGLSNITVWQDDNTVVLSFGTDLTFMPGDARLSEKGNGLLILLTPLMSKLPNTLEVTGHTDPTTFQGEGRYSSNWELSLARAQTVARALASDGYGADIIIRGRGASDSYLLPKDLPKDTRNELARRVDLRLHLVQP